MTTQLEKKKFGPKGAEMRLCKGRVGQEKDKYLKYEFQQIVLKTLLSKEKKKKMDDRNEKQFEIPKEFDVSLNLSNMNLTQFPKEILDKIEKVEYLYLEGNELSELPNDFFKKLPSLKWLDLRNNFLLSLPTEGLQNHSKLEIILLQGNRIRNLPVELAMVPYLKGLQTTGNPLKNVPHEAIAEGFQGIMKHLKSLCFKNEICFPVLSTVFVEASTSIDNQSEQSGLILNNPTDSEFRTWNLDKFSKWKHFIAKQSENCHPGLKNSKLKSERPVIQQPKISVCVRSYPKLSTKSRPFRCGVYHRNRHRNIAALNLKMKKSKLGYKRKPITLAILQDKARKESQRAQMREVLEKQAKKIQRMKDKEALKSWRDHPKITQQQIKLLDNFQQYPCKDFARRTPFDVDPEFLNMLNRVDLYRNLRDHDNRYKKPKKTKIRINTLDLEQQMNEIILKLQNLDTNENNEGKSPRSKRNHMCNKMVKILDMQKTLKKLQTLNSSMSGILPLTKQNQKIK